MRDYPSVPLPYPLEHPPAARALLRGDSVHPRIWGEVLFYPFLDGSLVLASLSGLPGDGFYGFHIHETGDCCPGAAPPFQCAGGHWNPAQVPHPGHAGDLPVLLASQGIAFSLVYTGRFTPDQAVGRTVIVHDMPDDYRSQPAGDSGSRIACGVIQ